MSFGAIPQEIIDTVLKQADIVDVVGKHVHLSKRGKNLIGLCPFHSEKTPSFTVNAEKQFYNCFGCGAGGNVIKFVMEIEGLSFPEAVRDLAEPLGLTFDWDSNASEAPEQQTERMQLIQVHELAAQWYHFLLRNSKHGREAMAYLRSRGFNDHLINTFQIGYAPPMWDTLYQFLIKRGFAEDLLARSGLVSRRTNGNGYVDRFRDRVMFPIWDPRGKVIAFGGRVLNQGEPKYLNSPETALFNKSRSLYNLHHAKQDIRKKERVILFEGYADVIKAWDADVHNGVATMGTALAKEHALLLKRFASEVVLCYDGDAAGQNAASKSIPILEEAGCEVKIAILPESLDPDEYISKYGSERFRQAILDLAVPATKFKLLYLRKNAKYKGDEGKLQYIHAALHIIARLHSPTEREHYMKELSVEFEYSLDVLKQTMHQIREQVQKLQLDGDNNDKPWNNVMNDKHGRDSVNLLPAFHHAERKLLALMLQNQEIALYVQEYLGDAFNVEAHAALAAYLYAFYAANPELEPGRFLASLQNDELERKASAILMETVNPDVSRTEIDDYIREIKKVPRQREIEQRKEDMLRAERSGDVMLAAQIASEIIALERQLKSLS